MEILYTNPLTTGGVQINPSKSIGGEVSASKVPNNFLSNIFSPITPLSLQTVSKEFIMIAVKNESLVNYINLKIKFDLKGVDSMKIETAFVLPAVDKCGNPVFEKIPNPNSTPYNAVFEEVEDGDEFEIGSLDAGKFLGIWLSRKLLPFDNSCERLKVLWEENKKDEVKKEEAKLIFSWDEEEESESVSNSISISVSESSSSISTSSSSLSISVSE